MINFRVAMILTIILSSISFNIFCFPSHRRYRVPVFILNSTKHVKNNVIVSTAVLNVNNMLSRNSQEHHACIFSLAGNKTLFDSSFRITSGNVALDLVYFLCI